jgi:outer membrane biosynthesis protein TonB
MKRSAWLLAALITAASLPASTSAGRPTAISPETSSLSAADRAVHWPVQITVRFIVRADGTTRDPFITRSTDRRFEKRAAQLVSSWHFTASEKPRARRMETTVVFQKDRQLTWKIQSTSS